MLAVLIGLFFIIVIGGLAYMIVQMLPLPTPFKQLALAIVLLVCLIMVLGLALGWMPWPHTRWVR